MKCKDTHVTADYRLDKTFEMLCENSPGLESTNQSKIFRTSLCSCHSMLITAAVKHGMFLLLSAISFNNSGVVHETVPPHLEQPFPIPQWAS